MFVWITGRQSFSQLYDVNVGEQLARIKAKMQCVCRGLLTSKKVLIGKIMHIIK